MSRLPATGFTLLEMLVVLTILTLLMSFVGPNFLGQLETSGDRFATDQFRSQLVQLPRWARLLGQPIKVDEISDNWQLGNEELLTLPPGWGAKFEPALAISTSQVCTSSTVTVFKAKGELATTFLIEGPGCTVTEATQ
ncbi:prepilin-type N-terminal cleavage/methylation domain-containing protein [Chitinimonas sp.]|uniref:prepilin-type N-terminal cleavage/methylation domain-containing protein n=1 Tax=Chitinimonas sp. TaxID=1934313 RepID=UPI002F94D1E6